MEQNMKMPLATYVLYHSEYSEGSKGFDLLYQLLCRDVNSPLTDGIDIPVYLRTGSDSEDIATIDFEQSEKTAIIILIDYKMFCSQKWRDYVKILATATKKNDNVKIYSIELCEYALDLTSESAAIQSIKLDSYSFVDNWKQIQIRLMESMYRLMKNPDSKVRIFISHAKKDCVCKAKQLRDYLNYNTKIDSFFDENDIKDGNDFETELKKGVGVSLLVVLETDVYSEREWCRREILLSKEYDVPVIVVNCIEKGTKRVFPYMGNCPMVRYSDDWSEMLICLLKTSLNKIYQDFLLKQLKGQIPEISNYITNSPELFSYLNLKQNEKQIILYPEPPLGREENEILNKFNTKIAFKTPTEVEALDSKFKEERIAFSVSESDDTHKTGCSNTMLKDVVIELSRYLLRSGAKLVYGGDLREQGYLDSFEKLSYQYGFDENDDKDVKYFTNYFAWPIYCKITERKKAEFIHNRVDYRLVDAPDIEDLDKNVFLQPYGNENLEVWAKSLTKMRREMVSDTAARIFIGGRLYGFKGKMAGVIEEFLLTAEKKDPIYLIGGFGGATKSIIDIRLGNDVDLMAEASKSNSYQSFFDYYNKRNPDDLIDYAKIINQIRKYDLNNGLLQDENERLYNSINIVEIVSLILKGLNKKK